MSVISLVQKGRNCMIPSVLKGRIYYAMQFLRYAVLMQFLRYAVLTLRSSLRCAGPYAMQSLRYAVPCATQVLTLCSSYAVQFLRCAVLALCTSHLA